MNGPETLHRARKKIAQLRDARERFDLDLSYSVASGWLAALLTEGVINSPIYHDLYRELDETHRIVLDELPAKI